VARIDGVALGTDAPPTPIDLQALAASAAEDWLRPSLAAGQDLGFDLAPATVLGHEHPLRELLGNLIHNTIEHAGRGAHVTVRTRRVGDRAELTVEDDGPGVAPGDRERVWERFRRGSGTTGPGSGLGLAIVRDIARVHAAQAVLEPSTGGRGLRVRVSFPAAPGGPG